MHYSHPHGLESISSREGQIGAEDRVVQVPVAAIQSNITSRRMGKRSHYRALTMSKKRDSNLSKLNCEFKLLKS